MTESGQRVRIAWLCLQGLGDSLMVTPAISRMKELRPDWDIHVVASQENCYELFSEHPDVSESHLFRYWSLGYRALLQDLPRLALQRFDVSLLAYPAVRNEYHLLAFAIGARKKIAHRKAGSRTPFTRLHDSLVDIRVAHNVVNNMNLLARLGLPADSPPASYSVPADWFEGRREPGRIGVHVGSMTYKGNELKRWPLQSHIRLGRLLRSHGFELVFIAGPNEMAETLYVRDDVDPRAGSITGPLREVSRALSNLSLVISADNGIAHLAAAVRTPVVVLFGPTDPVRCAPWGDGVRIVRPSECPPCFNVEDKMFVCKKGIDGRCVRRDISVQEVLQATLSAVAAPVR